MPVIRRYWGRAETHGWLTQAEKGAKDLTAARADLAAALTIALDYKYARRLLDKLTPASQSGEG